MWEILKIQPGSFYVYMLLATLCLYICIRNHGCLPILICGGGYVFFFSSAKEALVRVGVLAELSPIGINFSLFAITFILAAILLILTIDV